MPDFANTLEGLAAELLTLANEYRAAASIESGD